MERVLLVLILFYLTGCNHQDKQEPISLIPPTPSVKTASISTIGDIPAPPGFSRIKNEPASFSAWLRKLSFKKDKTVYLFNGEKKPNQHAQFAVIDMDRSKTDLQQCADVVIRMRAEYLFANKKFDSIRFMDYANKWYNWKGEGNRQAFGKYLQQVFGWCGCASLEKQLSPVKSFTQIKTGDVLIKGGFPGHAMLVADVAINKKGQKLFLLLQGYQPAQDIHVVINPSDQSMSPWYRIPGDDVILTPEWKFYKHQLYTW